MSCDDIAALFTLAAAHKADSEMDLVDEAFLATVAQGIPDGVRVVYLYADSDGAPTSIEGADHYDVFLLEFEGQEGQIMPVPLLVDLDGQLAASLFSAAEFRPREWEEVDDDALDARFDGDLGDNDPPV